MQPKGKVWTSTSASYQFMLLASQEDDNFFLAGTTYTLQPVFFVGEDGATI